MKIQGLAVIFIIIIIPITIVLSEYIDKKIDTEKLELEYNTRLLNSTHDAIKAYQLNTVSNAFGDITNLKIKDVESASKTFLNSLAANFNLTGYKNNAIEDYVPAVVFTMYDGYYTYAPFNNTLTEVESYDTEFSEDGQTKYGLKPYVYYSCRYTPNTNSDFVITYTLDNYITIQGNINGDYIYDYGYIYSIGNSKYSTGIYKDESTSSYWYDGIEFKKNYDTEEMKEYVGNVEYSYVKINGKKYYLDRNYYTDRGEVNERRTEDGITFEKRAGIFFIDSDGTKNYSTTKGYSSNNSSQDNENFLKYYKSITENNNAYEYYKNAYEFSRAALGNPVDEYTDKAGTAIGSGGYGLQNLKTSDALFYQNQQDNDTNTDSNITKLSSYGNFDIFGGTNNIQYENSNFNQHRKAIIRYVVETNLSSSITAFQSKAKNIKFIMPKISENDWEIIENDVCTISFLQGMSIGEKKYNGYAVVANSLTNEHIDENDIYILTTDKTYSRVNDNNLTNTNIYSKNDLGYYPGIWKLNFERRYDVSTESKVYYIPMSYSNNGEQTAYFGNYTSIMGSSGIKQLPEGDMYKYVSGLDEKLKKIYYHALGRERYEAFNINNVNYELNSSNNVTTLLTSSLNDAVHPGGEWNGTINEPDTGSTGLTPVIIGANGEITEVTDARTKWYDYNTTSDGSSRWANAVTKDSSGRITGYFVWIPRYEYQITDEIDTTGKGKVINVKFIPTSQTTPDEGYIIHPAFTNGQANNYKQGEWDEEISGFWVAKFQAGYQANTIMGTNDTEIANGITIPKRVNGSDTIVRSEKSYAIIDTDANRNKTMIDPSGYTESTKMSYPVFKPLTYAYNMISVGDISVLAKEIVKGTNFYGLKNTADSHMLKNSEWGAVAYLTQSNYGRHGREPYINNYYTSEATPNRTAITGLYASGTSYAATTRLTNAYYTTIGVKGSSTGNISGVYDLNGCLTEFVAGYISNGSPNLKKYGKNLIIGTGDENENGYENLSTKYVTIYPYNTSNDNATNNCGAYMNLRDEYQNRKVGYGDAILETLLYGLSSYGWHNDYNIYAHNDYAFFTRGGYYDGGSNSGIFEFREDNGEGWHKGGFRVVLIGK